MGIAVSVTAALSTAVIGATLASAPTSGAEFVSTSSVHSNNLELNIKPRFSTNIVEEHTKVTYDTVLRYTSSLAKGKKKVARTGSTEIQVKAYAISSIGTNVLGKKLVDEYVLKPGGPKVIFIGTFVAPKPKPKAKPVQRAATRETAASREVRSAWPRVRGAESLNWEALAQCESSGNPLAVNKSGPYYGLYQFLPSTWRSVGGTGLPTEASPDEQTYRAKLLWKRSGPGQWPVCGKRL